MAYADPSELLSAPPTGRILLAVIDSRGPRPKMRATLTRLRNAHPDCCLAVLGRGDPRQEVSARSLGALYLAGRVPEGHWRSLLAHLAAAPTPGGARPDRTPSPATRRLM